MMMEVSVWNLKMPRVDDKSADMSICCVHVLFCSIGIRIGLDSIPALQFQAS